MIYVLASTEKYYKYNSHINSVFITQNKICIYLTWEISNDWQKDWVFFIPIFKHLSYGVLGILKRNKNKKVNIDVKLNLRHFF